MHLQTRLGILFGLWFSLLPVWAQTAPTAATQFPADTQNQLSDENPAANQDMTPVPLPISSGANALSFSSEQERANYLSGGIGVGATYDDNALNTGSDRVGNFAYSILPHIVWDRATSRLRWTLNYSAGLIVNQELSQHNQNSQTAGVDFSYRLSPHVDLILRDQFSYTSGFLDGALGGSPAGGVLQQPNSFVITPLAQRTNNLGTAAITYQFGAGSTVGASGTFYTSHYGDQAGTTSLLDTDSQQADGFYTHRITPRNWAGVDYKFQRLTYDPTNDRTITHSFLFFDTLYLQRHMSLSFYGGPEYSQIENNIPVPVITLPIVTFVSAQVSTNHWSGAGGVNFNWQGEHTSFDLGASRGVSDGGGLLTTVLLTSVNGAVRRQLTRVSTLEFAAAYAVNDGFGDGSVEGNLIHSASAYVSWSRNIGKNLKLALGYARDYQRTEGDTLGVNKTNHNRGWVTISYDFMRPLGR